MYSTLLRYKLTGIHRLSGFKDQLTPSLDIARSSLNDFINLFCEYQLADNNYMNIHLEAIEHAVDDHWFNKLSIDQALRLLTYIIWTDKFAPGYLLIKCKDNTVYRVLSRLEAIATSSIVPATGNEERQREANAL